MNRIRWSCLAAALLFFSLMIGLGSIPGNATALTEKINDKLLHFLAYSLLTFLIYQSLIISRFAKFFTTLNILFVLSMADEIIQSHLSYRTTSLSDLIADMLAAFLVTTLLSLIQIDSGSGIQS